MKIRPVGAELFHSDGWTDGQTDAHDKAHGRVFVILQTRQKMMYGLKQYLLFRKQYIPDTF